MSGQPQWDEVVEMADGDAGKTGLNPYLSPLAVWALAVGSAIGWGSLVVTSRTYLSQAGPLGSVLGLLVGLAVMVMIAGHYHFLANRYPGTGGLYNYVKYIFGYDRAFLVAWFLFLVYIAIFWANATSIPLFTHYFLQDIFRFGYLYTIFDYDIYLGEALVTFAVIGLVALLCMKSKRATSRSMVTLVILFTVGITVCFVAALVGHGGTGMSMEPGFVPDKSALQQVLRIAFISPWAFIGFESVSHSAAEYKFSHRIVFRILVLALVVTTALYVFTILLSISAYPEGCSSWLDYISRLDEFEGLAGLPAFYAAHYYLGDAGVYILMASLLALVLSSLIGMLRAVSRLSHAVAQDGILPKRFAELSEKQIPVNAILLVLVVSLPIPFLGRTAIGWIVDTTTIGAIIIYGFASAAVFKVSRQEGLKRGQFLGGVCLAIMGVFIVLLIFPGSFADHVLETETFALMTIWSLLGLFYFNVVIRKDHSRNFGKAIIVWIALLAFIIVMGLTWSDRVNEERENAIIDDIYSYVEGTADSETLAMDTGEFLDIQRARFNQTDSASTLTVIGLFILSLLVLVVNYSSTKRWEAQAVEERDQARTAALTDPMTGVKSKHAFLLSEKQYNSDIEEGAVREFAVVVCDVNGLKVINDTYGHKAGDEYIMKATKMVCDIFQHSPVFRTGGDEFVVILTGRDYLIRKELLLALHDRSVDHIGTQEVVISGGLSEYRPGEDANFHEVFERADALMYEEKKLLKGMGSITREDAEQLPKIVAPIDENVDIVPFKRHVLIVEDDLINRELLGEMLGSGYELLYASDGVEAMEQVKVHLDNLALVLLDLQMPRMSGLEVLRVMKQEQELEDIPVIVMTADQSAELECLRIGAIDFIPKPYPTREIIQARVNRCIELSEKRNIIKTTERDSVTNLFTFDYFVRYVRLYDQHYSDMPMDAIVLDVNDFHVLNERYGRQYGDSVLSRIGNRIRRVSREIGGIGCRRGGDVFLVYCPHREDYESMLDQVSDGLAGEDVPEDRVRLRMGVYSQVDKSLEIDHRFDYARAAANTVKGSHLKAIGIYDEEMHEDELFKARLVEDFKRSLADRRFAVHFQPKFDIRPDEPLLASAEALVRWDHPEMGMISPGVFIPLFEEKGMILELDQFVWREAAATVRAWKNRFGFSVPVSVNVSRIDMLTPNLKQIFKEILEDYELSADDLVLEITESAYTGDSEQVISMARELRDASLGFKIEMDDFGTGYSSLSMLSSLPIDALKLDMSFIRSAFNENRDVRMIELIIDIADYLSVPVVAEGVETEEQYLVLKSMGCDLVQGYYFAKPVPPEDFDRFLAERADAKVAITPVVKKASMSVARALTGEFESVFYVDVVTGSYLEFHAGEGGELEVHPSGADFFEDARERLVQSVCEADAEKVRGATGREGLTRLIGQEEFELPFCMVRDEGLVPYVLQTIRTREGDGYHVAFGVRPE